MGLFHGEKMYGDAVGVSYNGGLGTEALLGRRCT